MEQDLTDQQLNELKSLLRRRREELREEVREELLRVDEPRHTELAGQVNDEGDVALADLLMDQNLYQVERHARELRQVDDALKRIDEGSYGICVDTGEPIPYERLRAYPTATRTVEAQEIYEREYRESEPPTL